MLKHVQVDASLTAILSGETSLILNKLGSKL